MRVKREVERAESRWKPWLRDKSDTSVGEPDGGDADVWRDFGYGVSEF